MRKVLRIGSERKPKTTKQENAFSTELNAKIEMIQALIPIGLMAVAEQLEEEVKELAGERYSHQVGNRLRPLPQTTARLRFSQHFPPGPMENLFGQNKIPVCDKAASRSLAAFEVVRPAWAKIKKRL